MTFNEYQTLKTNVSQAFATGQKPTVTDWQNFLLLSRAGADTNGSMSSTVNDILNSIGFTAGSIITKAKMQSFVEYLSLGDIIASNKIQLHMNAIIDNGNFENNTGVPTAADFSDIRSFTETDVQFFVLINKNSLNYTSGMTTFQAAIQVLGFDDLEHVIYSSSTEVFRLGGTVGSGANIGFATMFQSSSAMPLLSNIAVTISLTDTAVSFKNNGSNACSIFDLNSNVNASMAVEAYTHASARLQNVPFIIYKHINGSEAQFPVVLLFIE